MGSEVAIVAPLPVLVAVLGPEADRSRLLHAARAVAVRLVMLTSIPTPEAISEAIDWLNDLVAAIGAHRHRGKYEAEQLLDRIEGEAREVRKLLERIADPAG